MSQHRTPVPERFRNEEPFASEPQVNYLEKLRDGKDLSGLRPDQIAWLRDADFTRLKKRRASDIITQLKELPWAPKDNSALIAFPDVKDGRYAVEKEDGTLMFYSIKKGKYTIFVDVWASDARYPIKNGEKKRRVLDAIRADPDAGPRFGREIGRCYVCGRTLTDETSRALGIGPICRDA